MSAILKFSTHQMMHFAPTFGEVSEYLIPQKQVVLFKNADIEYLALL